MTRFLRPLDSTLLCSVMCSPISFVMPALACMAPCTYTTGPCCVRAKLKRQQLILRAALLIERIPTPVEALSESSIRKTQTHGR